MKLSLTFVLIFGLMKISFGQEYYRNWTVQNDSKKENIALIIANNHYESGGNLNQPIPTAKKLEMTLKNKGFDIMVGRDLDRTQMANIINEFSKKYENYKFAMIAYLGHGFEINGKNYLIPIDANPPSKEEVELEAINLDYILKKISNPKIAKAIILDACRDNPFVKNWSSSERSGVRNGFVEVSAPRNAEVFFTIQKNTKVNDENPYIQYFMEELNEGGCLDDIIRNVSKRIYFYDSRQIPASYGQILEDVCFGVNPIEPNPKTIKGFILDSKLEKWVQTNGIENLTREAIGGNIVAQRRLGRIFDFGIKVKEDDFKAVQWYQKSANQGDPIAQKKLGDMYLYGYGIKESRKEALKWYKKAANQDYSDAQNSLGHIYSSGDTEDFGEALKWYTKAAIKGNSDAQYYLGYTYYYGNNFLNRNKKEGLKWLKKAANQDNEDALEKLDWIKRHDGNKY